MRRHPKIRAWLFVAGGICGLLPAPLHAEELEGAIVVARDVPTRHAFLPGTGEPLIVKTAPFLDVWGAINPGEPLTDGEAETIVGRWHTRGLAINDLDKANHLAADSAAVSAAGLDRGGSAGAGIGGLVSEALDSGLGSLQVGLGEMRAAVAGGG